MQNGNKVKKRNNVGQGAVAGRRVRKTIFEYGKSRWPGRKRVHRTVKDRLFRFERVCSVCGCFQTVYSGRFECSGGI